MKQKAEVDRLLKDLDYPTHYVKDLPDDGPRATTRSKVSVSYIKDGCRLAYEMDDAEFQAGGYYYPMSNNNYPSPFNYLTEFATMALNVTCILLVPKVMWKKFEANPKWKLIEPALDALLKANEKAARAIYGSRYDQYPFTNFRQYAGLAGPVGDFARKTMTTFPDKFLGLTHGQWDIQLSRLNLGGFNTKQQMAELKMILDKYPLLKLENNSKAHYQSFVDYITLIDNASKE
jgi:hypothetical protein